MRNLILYDTSRYGIIGGITGATDALLVDDFVYMVIDNLLYEYDTKKGYDKVCVSEKYKCLTRICLMVLDEELWFGTGTEFIYYNPKLKMMTVINSPVEFTAAEWSPSQDILIIISVTAEVLVCSIDKILKQIDCLGSCQLSDPITKVFTNVGWGSSVTQFRGSEGKLSKTCNKIEVTVKEVFDKYPRIVWRDDGEYFLVNYWVEGQRRFKVFEHPCVPVYACEDTPGLQAPISWRCTGNMIACPVYTDIIRITIFEKNGLPRHSFDLHDQIDVVDLLWNSTGEILAVSQKSADQACYLSLYKMNNYHWYLKQRLDFTKDNNLTSFKWSNRTDSIFELVVTTTMEVLIYQFIYEVHRFRNSDTYGTCAVVDANKILIYNFSNAIIAPPDASEVVELANPVAHILFHTMEPEMFVIDCKNHCYLFIYNGKSLAKSVEYDLDVPAKFAQHPYNFHHFCWRNDRSLFAIAVSDVIVTYNSNLELLMEDTLDAKSSSIDCLNETGYFLKRGASKEFSSSLVLYVDVCEFENRVIYVALNLANQFYIDAVCIAENITSYLLHGSYLYLTTQDRLYCLRLTMKDIDEVVAVRSIENFYWREMEKGGLLIAGIQKKAGVVLQMPRGNLEVNTCRITAIDKLENYLQEGMWEEAFKLTRMERLNSNLLIDLNPSRFLKQLRDFLLSVDSSNLIVGFLQEIVEENVLQTIYKNCRYDCVIMTNKKKSVCQAVISCANDIDVIAFIKVIVMAIIHATGLDQAVNCLKEVYCTNVDAVLKGLDCLKLYFSYEDICTSALSSYDTDFALFVYENSSMDPKIYKPMLEEFNKSEDETTKRFKINDYLGQRKAALMYLARSISHRILGEEKYSTLDVNPLIQYAEKYQLFPDLYNMTTSTTLFYTEISLAYGSFLKSKQCHKEAAIVYSCANFYEAALEQYKLCHQWQKAIIMLEKMKADETQKLLHVAEIARGLENSGDYKNASFLCEVYLNDCELALIALVNGKLFGEAVRVSEKFRRFDLIQTIVEPKFLEFVSDVNKKLISSQSTFNKHKSRLKIARQKKIEEYVTSEESFDVNVADTASQQSSAVSVSSRSTRSNRSRMSTKSRRKEELKMRDLREGGYYEDIALMRALHQLIKEIFDYGPEIGDICHLLLLFKHPKAAKDLQNLLENMQTVMMSSFAEIWPENLNSFSAPATPELLALRENLEFLEFQFRCPPDMPRQPWKVNLT